MFHDRVLIYDIGYSFGLSSHSGIGSNLVLDSKKEIPKNENGYETVQQAQ